MSSSSLSAPKHAPRLRCRCVRTWCALGGSASGHVAQCAECRTYFAAGETLDASLRRDAAINREPADPERVRDILHAVRTSAAPTEAAERRPWSALWPIAIAAAAAAVVAGFSLRGRGDVLPPGNPTAEARVLADKVKSLSSNLVESVLPSAGEMVANNPMQDELDAIYTDAKSAWGFLALNFVPSAQTTGRDRSG